MMSSSPDPKSSADRPLQIADVSATANASSTNSNANNREIPLELKSCPHCHSESLPHDGFCNSCGIAFPEEALRRAERTGKPSTWGQTVGGRFQIGSLINQRGNAQRFRGIETRGNDLTPLSVVIVREPIPAPVPLKPSKEAAKQNPKRASETIRVEGYGSEPETVNEFDLPKWPAIAWEKRIIEMLNHLSFPRIIDCFEENGFRYLIVEVPAGQLIWDAWEARTCTWAKRMSWLIQLAEAMNLLHRRGACFESLHPDMIMITPTGQAVIADCANMLPLPLPANMTLRGNFYTAPELLAGPARADARSNMYSLGAITYSLLQKRELTKHDFTETGSPRSILEVCPDIHPMLGRLLHKTFVREVSRRFPTDEALGIDHSGFREFVQVLGSCQRNLDRVRLEIAAWTTTGVSRSGNEDAYAILHSAEARLEEGDEFAVLLLADGMGGMESGEVASELAIHSLRCSFLQQPPFLQQTIPILPGSAEAAKNVNEKEGLFSDGLLRPAASHSKKLGRLRQDYQERVIQALREANRKVYEASRVGVRNRGMGCTAEVVVIDGCQVVVGHVGDSRTYHQHRSKLTQISRDQTLVTRLLELGHITREEAQRHPRRSELQQAIGGRSEVLPETYQFVLQAGDWILVCSDGLTNQIPAAVIERILEESISAESAARRLVNLANLEGASDNVTVIVVSAH